MVQLLHSSGVASDGIHLCLMASDYVLGHVPPVVARMQSRLEEAIASNDWREVEAAVNKAQLLIQQGHITGNPRGKLTPRALARANKVLREPNALPGFYNQLLDIVQALPGVNAKTGQLGLRRGGCALPKCP